VVGEAESKVLCAAFQSALGPEVTLYAMHGWGSDPPPEVISASPAAALKGNAALYVAEALGAKVEDCIAAGGGLVMLVLRAC
jgi:hydroxymethylpyrimidine pyrophosphatase-like HAD family hydrolase